VAVARSKQVLRPRSKIRETQHDVPASASRALIDFELRSKKNNYALLAPSQCSVARSRQIADDVSLSLTPYPAREPVWVKYWFVKNINNKIYFLKQLLVEKSLK
jgi:hypothetical protein